MVEHNLAKVGVAIRASFPAPVNGKMDRLLGRCQVVKPQQEIRFPFSVFVLAMQRRNAAIFGA